MKKKKQIVLINASAAKFGGAATIIKTFVDSINSFDKEFIIISPLEFECSKPNIQFIKLKTSGIGTVFFTCLGILFYIWKYNPCKIISFNNVNSVFYSSRGITYFHQLKALKNYKDLKVTLYVCLIRYFLTKNTFVVQTQDVKKLFLKKFKFSDSKIVTCWPGFLVPEPEYQAEILNTLLTEKKLLTKKASRVGVLPISENSFHKNVGLLHSFTNYFEKNNIHIITLLNDEISPFKNKEVYSNINIINRRTLFSIYSFADFMVFTSLDETIGLPIFEFLQTGKPAYVYKASYAESLKIQFNYPSNLHLFGSEIEFYNQFEEKEKNIASQIDYSIGEWNKIFKLL